MRTGKSFTRSSPRCKRSLASATLSLGLTGALFLWVYGLCSPLPGILGDRCSKTKLIVGSLVRMEQSYSVVRAVAERCVSAQLPRLLGVSESLFMPAAYALMANAHGPATRSKAIAIFGTSQLVGVALGGSLSGFIAERLHWRVSFWMLGLAGLLFAFPLARFLRSLPDHFHMAPTPGKNRQPSVASSICFGYLPSGSSRLRSVCDIRPLSRLHLAADILVRQIFPRDGACRLRSKYLSANRHARWTARWLSTCRPIVRLR